MDGGSGRFFGGGMIVEGQPWMADPMVSMTVSWRNPIMTARGTRKETRARILAAFTPQLDRVIPEDGSVPLKGATFFGTGGVATRCWTWPGFLGHSDATSLDPLA